MPSFWDTLAQNSTPQTTAPSGGNSFWDSLAKNNPAPSAAPSQPSSLPSESIVNQDQINQGNPSQPSSTPVLSGLGNFFGGVANDVKGWFTPSGGKPTPITLPNNVKSQSDLSGKIANLSVGDTIDAGASAKLQPNVIDRVFDPLGNVFEGVYTLLGGSDPNGINSKLFNAENQYIVSDPALNNRFTQDVLRSTISDTLNFSPSVENALKTQLPTQQAKTFTDQAVDTVGNGIGQVIGLLGTGKLFEAAGLTKLLLPATFATIGQLSTSSQASLQDRIEKVPEDAVLGWLFSKIPDSQNLVSTQTLKSAGLAGALTGGGAFVSALLQGMKPEDAAKIIPSAFITGSLFYGAANAIGLGADKLTTSNIKQGSAEFTPQQARDIVMGSNLENTDLGNEILKASLDAEGQGKNIQITGQATQKSGVAKALNLKTPEGLSVGINLVEPTQSAQLPTSEQAPAESGVEQTQNIAPSSPGIAPLGQEVTVYRGTTTPGEVVNTNKANGITGGESFTTTPQVAQNFATNKGGEVQQFTISKDANVIDHSVLEKLVSNVAADKKAATVAKFLKLNNVDVVRFDVPEGSGGEQELRVINPAVLTKIESATINPNGPSVENNQDNQAPQVSPTQIQENSPTSLNQENIPGEGVQPTENKVTTQPEQTTKGVSSTGETVPSNAVPEVGSGNRPEVTEPSGVKPNASEPRAETTPASGNTGRQPSTGEGEPRPGGKSSETTERTPATNVEGQSSKISNTVTAVDVVNSLQDKYGKYIENSTVTELKDVLSDLGNKPIALDKGIDQQILDKITSPRKGIDASSLDSHPQLFWGNFKNGVFTDGFILITDKSAAKSVNDKLLEVETNRLVKDYQKETGANFEESSKAINQQIQDSIDKVTSYPDITKVIPQAYSDTAARAIGFKSGDPTMVYLADGTNNSVVGANKLAFMQKYLPGSEIRLADSPIKPIAFVKDGKVTGVLMPIKSEGENPFKYVAPKEEVKPEIAPVEITPIKESAINIPDTKVLDDALSQASEQGFIDPEAFTDAAKETINNVKDFIDKTQVGLTESKELSDSLYNLKTNISADYILARKLLESTKLSSKDAEAIYHYDENKASPITPEQKKVYEEVILPIKEANSEMFERIKDVTELPINPDEYTPRFVKNTGNVIDRLLTGVKGVRHGGILSKSTGSLLHRVMRSLTDENGVRVVVAVKDNTVTRFDNGKAEYMGVFKKPITPKMKEFFDQKLVDQLNKVAKDLGITHVHGAKLRGNIAGQASGNTVKTRFATPEEVLIHEIGHIIDERYKLQLEFVNNKDTKVELRNLADERYTGQEVSNYFKRYVRKGEEKMAVMFEAYLHAPEIFQDVAPNTYQKFVDFLSSHEELKPILDIKPSLVLGSNTFGGNPNRPGVFVDKTGKRWKVGEATTKEIETNTSLTYHKNVLANYLLSYLKLNQIDRAVQFLEDFKSSPEFETIAAKEDSGEIPANWRPTKVLQFRGYYFEPHVAETLDNLYSLVRGEQDPLRALTAFNDVFRTAIFIGPGGLGHVPNVAVHWLTNRGVTPFLDPRGYPTLAKTTLRAIKAVTTFNEDYVDMLRSGAPLQYANRSNRELSDLFLKKLSADMERSSADRNLQEAAKILGYANPLKWAKGLLKFSNDITWWTNDVATLQAIYEEEAHGVEHYQAIEEVGKHIPNYRLPTRILNSKAVADILKNPNLSMFSSYHYGMIRSYAEMAKTLLGRDSTVKDRAKILDKLLMLFILGVVVYPFLDNLAKRLTGKSTSYVSRAGALTVPQNIYLVTQGQKNWLQVLFGIVTPSAGSMQLAQIIGNRDFFTGKQLYDTSSLPGITKGVGTSTLQNLTPVDAWERLQNGKMSLTDYLATFGRIYSPKSGLPAEKVNSYYFLKAQNDTNYNAMRKNPNQFSATERRNIMVQRAEISRAGQYVNNYSKLPPNSPQAKQYESTITTLINQIQQ